MATGHTIIRSHDHTTTSKKPLVSPPYSRRILGQLPRQYAMLQVVQRHAIRKDADIHVQRVLQASTGGMALAAVANVEMVAQRISSETGGGTAKAKNAMRSMVPARRTFTEPLRHHQPVFRTRTNGSRLRAQLFAISAARQHFSQETFARKTFNSSVVKLLSQPTSTKHFATPG